MTEKVQTPEVQETAAPQAEATATPEQPTLGVGDLAAMVQVIDIVSERGAFKGPELESVGVLRGRIARFIEANKAASEAAAETEGAEGTAPAAE
jgi:hypothetical protein